MLARRVLVLLLSLACAGCWVNRIGPNYQYEAEGDAWQGRNSYWHLERDGVRWTTEVWHRRDDMLVLALLNTSEGEKRVRVHGLPGATYRWHLGENGDSHPGPVLDARYGEDWITVPKLGKATITLKLADLRGTAKAREGDRVRFAIEDAVGRLDCEFRLERIAYDYLLVSLVLD